jgi:hypothetical protein
VQYCGATDFISIRRNFSAEAVENEGRLPFF